ncbi:MAG: DUF5719 family protein [Acidimicrobiales bacterium]
MRSAMALARSAKRRVLAIWSSGASRYSVLALLVPLVVAGLLAGSPGGEKASEPAVAPAPSLAKATALSSSWFCAGATAGAGSPAAGAVVLDNSAPGQVAATVQLVAQSGTAKTFTVVVPGRSTRTVVEQLARRPWVGAVVTFYGGMAVAAQEVTTSVGTVSQPCASSASGRWYFPFGATFRNADEYVSLLNPYPLDAIADLSFTTDQGQENPAAFQGVVVPAHGLAVVDLRSYLSRRRYIALTVSTRGGQIVAFETEVVSAVPAGTPFLGAKGAPDPALPAAAVDLLLGAPSTALSWWWPGGGDGPGLNETYVLYDPGPQAARLSLSLVPQGDTVAASTGGSVQLAVAPYGVVQVTTNGQPWALPGTPYAAYLQSLNGVPIVAERTVTGSVPSAERGRAALLGETMAATSWLLTPGPREMAGVPVPPRAAPTAHAKRGAGHTSEKRKVANAAYAKRGAAPTDHSARAIPTARAKRGAAPTARRKLRAAQGAHVAHHAKGTYTVAVKRPVLRPPQTWVRVLDPGGAPAVVKVEPVEAAKTLPVLVFTVSARQCYGLVLPAGLAGVGLRVSSSQPVLVEEDSYASPGALGINLAPAVPLAALTTPGSGL